MDKKIDEVSFKYNGRRYYMTTATPICFQKDLITSMYGRCYYLYNRTNDHSGIVCFTTSGGDILIKFFDPHSETLIDAGTVHTGKSSVTLDQIIFDSDWWFAINYYYTSGGVTTYAICIVSLDKVTGIATVKTTDLLIPNNASNRLWKRFQNNDEQYKYYSYPVGYNSQCLYLVSIGISGTSLYVYVVQYNKNDNTCSVYIQRQWNLGGNYAITDATCNYAYTGTFIYGTITYKQSSNSSYNYFYINGSDISGSSTYSNVAFSWYNNCAIYYSGSGLYSISSSGSTRYISATGSGWSSIPYFTFDGKDKLLIRDYIVTESNNGKLMETCNGLNVRPARCNLISNRDKVILSRHKEYVSSDELELGYLVYARTNSSDIIYSADALSGNANMFRNTDVVGRHSNELVLPENVWLSRFPCGTLDNISIYRTSYIGPIFSQEIV